MQDLSPLDIQKQTFVRKFKGYDPDEVRVYLQMVAEEIERLVRDVDRFSRENAMLREDLEDHSQREQILKDTLLSAQKVSEEVKANARKLRRLGKDANVLAGFAGATADAFTLFELFEAKLDKHGNNLTRAAVELAKEWRTDRRLGRLEAMLAVADKDASLLISGNGDVLEPENGLIAIGSGGPYAQAAAKALMENSGLPAREIVERALKIAGDICIYTNHNVTIEEL